jgi:hypothetical protein
LKLGEINILLFFQILSCTQEVTGSSPVSPTILYDRQN